jgi:hypothetical protein
MTLFEKTIPKMSYDIQYPEAHAKEQFTYTNRDAEYIISAISEDSGDTICSRSLIMLLQQMTERIYDLECEIRKLNGEN